ncbi:MAG: hypothetical protein K2W95_13680 [Candidatus Obscuribacterales bacterium]|nr:hypothetical protein [Candidatus Obscuribacterales bacterium]
MDAMPEIPLSDDANHSRTVEQLAAEMLRDDARVLLSSHDARTSSTGNLSGFFNEAKSGTISGLADSGTDPWGHLARIGCTSAAAWRIAGNHTFSPFRSIAGRVVGAAVLATICTRVAEQLTTPSDVVALERTSTEVFAHEVSRFAADVSIASGIGIALGRSRWLTEGEKYIDHIIDREKTLLFTGPARSYCRGGKMRHSTGYRSVVESAEAKAQNIRAFLNWREQPQLIPKAFESLQTARPGWRPSWKN